MKQTFLFLFLLTACAPLALAQGPKSNAKVEQAVIQLEKDWANALVKADTAALDKLYADSLVYTHSSGAVDDKATYIANIKSGKSKYEMVDLSDFKVNVYGDTAISFSTGKLRVLTGGQTLNNTLKIIHVYVKQGKDWRMVAHQTTRVAQ
jgi:ketosteroid isomerase-like protein